MPELTAEQFAQLAFNLNLLDEQQLNRAWGELGTRDVPAEVFHQHLVGANLLTNFQIDRILRGERSGYFYGDYKVLYLAGKGTFSRVYRAVHKETGKVVAVKVLRRSQSDSPTAVSQFVHEAETGLKLRHPNIVPVYEYYSKGMRHYLVMDFIEGQTLRDFLRIRRRFEPLEATRLILDVATGLAYAADRGITHRDLKLTNVLVSSRGQAKLVDFGLAAADSSRNVSSDQISDLENPRTIDYAGLERATGVKKDDARSDIYFAGCMYYHLLTGKPPLTETKNRVERLSKARFTDVVPIARRDPSLPAIVVHIVSRAMELDPCRRYQSPREMVADLQIAMERIAHGASSATAEDPEKLAEVDAELRRSGGQSPAVSPGTVLVVESDIRLQDLFRQQLKALGFRVLIISDPARALSRFEGQDRPAECVVFSTRGLGKAAVDGFHQCMARKDMEDVGVILLVDARHAEWQVGATPGDRGAVVTMPIKAKEFQRLLLRLTRLRSPQPSSLDPQSDS